MFEAVLMSLQLAIQNVDIHESNTAINRAIASNKANKTESEHANTLNSHINSMLMQANTLRSSNTLVSELTEVQDSTDDVNSMMS